MPTPTPDPHGRPAGPRHSPQAPLQHLGAFNPLRHVRVSDLRCVAQLATQASLHALRVAEDLQAAWKPVLRDMAGEAPEPAPATVPPRRDPRLDQSMRPYSGLRGFVRLSGQGADALLAGVDSLLGATGHQPPETPQRAAALAVVNAVAGERLAATRNPLATDMVFIHQGQALRKLRLPAQAGVRDRVVLMVHGRGTTEHVWHSPVQRRPAGTPMEEAATAMDHGETDRVHHAMHHAMHHGMGEALAAALGCTVLYLRYNSGLPVAENGHALGKALEEVLTHWPVPVDRFAIVAHGQGGLVARSAVHFGRQQAKWHWPHWLRHLVFLGTPHHALAPGDTPPLPEGIACCTIAGTLAGRVPPGPYGMAGDGIVSVAQALGHHSDPQRSLVFAHDAQHIVPHTHHLRLPRSPEVARKVIDWLQAG